MSQQNSASVEMHLLVASSRRVILQVVLLSRDNLLDSFLILFAVREQAVVENCHSCLVQVRMSEDCYVAGFDSGHLRIVVTSEAMEAVVETSRWPV